MGHRAEELLLTIPEIQTVARKTGRAELDEHALGVNVSEIEAPFELKDRPRSELVAEVREKLGTITGANIEIGQPISHRIDAMLSGTKANIAIKLFGDDLNKMFSLGNQIKGAISDIPGIADLNVCLLYTSSTGQKSAAENRPLPRPTTMRGSAFTPI